MRLATYSSYLVERLFYRVTAIVGVTHMDDDARWLDGIVMGHSAAIPDG